MRPGLTIIGREISMPAGDEGKPVKVKVYSSYPEVILELNGEEIGTRKIEGSDKYIAEFEVF